MKKFTPYVITAIVLAFLAMIVVAANRKMPRKMDERITLRQKDKIPYGMAAAKTLCSSLFPDAEVSYDSQMPGSWNNISLSGQKQAVILVAGYFNADEYEIRQLMQFVDNGNYVFIIAKVFSTDAENAFGISYSQKDFSSLFGETEDSLRVRLAKPSFASDSLYVYPGKKFDSWFDTIDTTHTIILGRNDTAVNFIQLNKGDGAFFIHAAPLAFSNYFILHKNNIHYFEQVMSVIPSDVKKIVWNEYYLTKKNGNNNGDKEPNWLGILFRYPEFKWGLLTVLFGILLLVILGSRRKQRMIPQFAKPRNESLDFVKTMGRLYYDRRDHHNLAKKMAVYFLEHVRSTYKLPTNSLDEHFIENLHFKSGYSKGELNEIVSFVNYLQTNHLVTEFQLTHFHNQLESFYQNT